MIRNAAIIAFFFSLLLFSGCLQTGTDWGEKNYTNISEQNITSLSVSTGDLPALGQESAPVTWIEFSDYQCPYCSKLATGSSAQVKNSYVKDGKVKMYFRDYPLYFHDKANEAALAARCANEQGKFWEMHDKLFQNQQSWEVSSDFTALLQSYATELGMDNATFSSCFASSKYASAISADSNAGQSAGVTGTPTVFMLLPKNKTDYSKLKTSLSTGYGPYMELYQDQDNYIVKIAGAFPYSSYQSVLETLS